MIPELKQLFDRDIQKIAKEIEAFQQEENLWKKIGTVPNTAGNLAMHLVGNLKNYIGKNLGEIPYTRDREAEFNASGKTKAQLVAEIWETREAVMKALDKITESKLDEDHPEQVFAEPLTNRMFLMHLLAHLSYHLGQLNYLRQTLE